MMEDNNTFECVKLINETNIEFKKKHGIDCAKDLAIEELLRDRDIFSKISKERALQLLNELEIKNAAETYKKLIM